MRTYAALFQHPPRLMTDTWPRVGDWAFYGRTHVALVVDVQSDSAQMTKTYGPVSFFGRLNG